MIGNRELKVKYSVFNCITLFNKQYMKLLSNYDLLCIIMLYNIFIIKHLSYIHFKHLFL